MLIKLNNCVFFFSVSSSCLVSSAYTATAPAPQLGALLVAHTADVERCFS